MAEQFTAMNVLPGVWHIKDEMGVCMTLLAGGKAALLVDTGYGASDVAVYVRTLTDKPLMVMLTHAHHDHALGARWFKDVYLFPEDQACYDLYTGDEFRNRVSQQAQSKGVALPKDFLTAKMPAPLALQEGDIDLGGMTARVIRQPSHTPGSAVVLVPERELLLTGDAWNPCTWMFFPEAAGVRDCRHNLRCMLELPFRHVLASHRHEIAERGMVDNFAAALTDENLDAANPVNVGYPQDTRQVLLPHGQQLVFDWNKYQGVE